MKLFVATLFVCFFAVVAIASEPGSQKAGEAAAAAQVPFTSNGCSGFREATFFTCCFGHDFAFWAGGSRKDRSAADHVLRRCIQDIAHDYYRSYIAFFLMRLGLGSGVFVYDGWGRAWQGADRGRFTSLSPVERRIVEDTRKNICQSMTLDASTGLYAIDARFIRDSEHRHLRPREAREFCGGELLPR